MKTGGTTDALQQVREAFEAVQPSAGLHYRLRHSMQHGQKPTRAGRGVVAVGAVAFVLGAVLAWGAFGRSTPTELMEQPVAAHAPTTATPNTEPALQGHDMACTVATSTDGVMQIASGCRVALPDHGIEVDAWTPTQLRSTSGGVVMHDGLAAFSVEHVVPGATPVEVDVGNGVIRVIGTRFVVRNDHGNGHVDLLEGQIEFIDAGGTRHVEPGQRLHWTAQPRALPKPADHTAPSRSPPQPPTVPTRSLATTLEAVARLRRQQAYDEALAELDAARGGSDRTTRAVLSYERGTLLEAAGRTEQACAHWLGHLRRFSDTGPQDGAKRRSRLECDP